MTEALLTGSDNAHSIFGASGAKRWRTCGGSVALIEAGKATGEIPEKTTSSFADEGTEAHEWANRVLVGEIPLEEVPDDFRAHLTGYINFCRGLEAEAVKIPCDAIVLKENTVPLYYRPQDQGTVDFAVASKLLIHGVDLKYGAGVKVEAVENDQLAIYMLSLIKTLEDEQGKEFPDETPVSLTVYQPRHFSFNGPETWNISLRDLKDIGIDIEEDYQKAKGKGPLEFQPSQEACQFCDAKSICTARGQVSFSGFPSVLNPMDDFPNDTTMVAPAVETLTEAQRGLIIDNAAMLKKFVEDVVKAENKRLREGGEPTTHKLVENPKKKARKWVDEKEAETLLRGKLKAEDAYQPRKLISMPQAEGKLKGVELSTRFKNRLKELTHQEPGNPILVGTDDPRPALEFKGAEDEF